MGLGRTSDDRHIDNLFFQVNDPKQKIKARKSAEAQMILDDQMFPCCRQHLYCTGGMSWQYLSRRHTSYRQWVVCAAILAL